MQTVSGAVDCLCASTLDGMELWGVIVGGVGGAAGVIAVIYAAIANHRSKQSNDLARESNDISKDAKRLAQEANQISQRAEHREVERHDVHWEGIWQEPGIYLLVKRGDDEAHNVVATVKADGVEQTKTADLVTEDGSAFEYEFPHSAALFRQEADAHLRQKAEAARSPFPGFVSAVMANTHPVSERVEWSTKRGTPKTHVVKVALTDFGRFLPR